MFNQGMGIEPPIPFEDWDRSLKLSETDSRPTTSPRAARTPSEPAENEADGGPLRDEQLRRTRNGSQQLTPSSSTMTMTTATTGAAAAITTAAGAGLRGSVSGGSSTGTSSTRVTPPPAPAATAHAAGPRPTVSSRQDPPRAPVIHRVSSVQSLQTASKSTADSPQAHHISSLSMDALTAVASAVGPVPMLASTIERDEHRLSPSTLTPRRPSSAAAGCAQSPSSHLPHRTSVASTSPAVTPRGAGHTSPSSRYAALARPTPSRYQVFLFHGVPHVLDHQTGLVIPQSAFETEARAGVSASAAVVAATAAAPSSSPSPLSGVGEKATFHTFHPFDGAPRFRLPTVATTASAISDSSSSPPSSRPPLPPPTVTRFLCGVAEDVHARTLTFLSDGVA